MFHVLIELQASFLPSFARVARAKPQMAGGAVKYRRDDVSIPPLNLDHRLGIF
jgi:hypothetical protein